MAAAPIVHLCADAQRWGLTGAKASISGLARHQKGIRMHLKCLLGADDLDDDAVDDPAFLEDNDSEVADVESKALLVELQKLVAQAGELASA